MQVPLLGCAFPVSQAHSGFSASALPLLLRVFDEHAQRDPRAVCRH